MGSVLFFMNSTNNVVKLSAVGPPASFSGGGGEKSIGVWPHSFGISLWSQMTKSSPSKYPPDHIPGTSLSPLSGKKIALLAWRNAGMSTASTTRSLQDGARGSDQQCRC